jgi:hypothetical protein
LLLLLASALFLKNIFTAEIAEKNIWENCSINRSVGWKAKALHIEHSQSLQTKAAPQSVLNSEIVSL